MSNLNNLLEQSTNLSQNTYKTELDVALGKQEVKTKKKNRKEREKYARYSFLFLCVFTSLILTIILLSGFGDLICFYLSNTVLITLITTSLTTIVSIFIIVMKYLFK